MTKTSILYSSLLITDSTNPESNQILIETLTDLGFLQIISASEKTSFQKKIYDLIIVDSVSVTDPITTVSEFHVLDSKAKIVVMSASTHWKIAKAIIQAGAIDYLPKSLTKEELLAKFQTILKDKS